MAKTESVIDVTMNMMAAQVVALESTVAAVRVPKAVWLPMPPKAAAMSAYRTVWCDNMTPNGCDPSGTTKWDGDKLVGTMEGDMNGQKMVTRFTYSDFKPGSFVMTMEMGPDASKLQKAMTITYSKAGAAEKKM